ncbi:hypothetical protein [Robiginitomaculum antarcticum]|uniref:hypothetical protein n=1 Tax=Robiginitomaculum antarcticum TaxID=437507 RepID=UPI000376E36A|nr:hypothetical protein [Robiginitomaculum antarcticum]
MEDIVEAHIEFLEYDYVINGAPLHPAIMDGIKAGGPNDFGGQGSRHFASSVICQPETLSRLLGEKKNDLIHGLTSLYVCGHCGGYDGTLIGVHVNVYERSVVWSNIGFTSDTIELNAKHIALKSIPTYSFKKSNYNDFIEQARKFETQ